MNEDDTTQSLSDKVLDRSNILRFGRPEELRVSNQETNEGIASKPRLAYSSWQEWVREPLGADTEWGRQLHQLNEALEFVGRPFGHRVFRSILAYLGNYPDQSDEGMKMAFADQIEVKILPKLRGMETMTKNRASSSHPVNELFGVIGDLTEQTGDKELSNAFERSCLADFFNFTGVLR